MYLPRPEYPRPQFTRAVWLNLNGEWQFEFDPGDSGLERGLLQRELAETITVPFCPESELSGIGDTDFHQAVWYRRDVQVPAEWAGQRILLHFQAVDYDATIWAQAGEAEPVEVARHRGGFTPFSADLTGIALPGQDVTISLRARDYHDRPMPSGKQSRLYHNHSCLYTRTTGIWQTVWLEPVADVYFLRPRVTPDLANRRFRLELPLSEAPRQGFQVRAALLDQGDFLTQVEIPADQDFAPQLDLIIPAKDLKLWAVGAPHLYDLVLELIAPDGSVCDRVESYAGLRSITRQGRRILINGQPVFQRLVLDQGFYPDGILTASSDEALIADIELSQAAGFNGARLHQKVFEERFLYHADRLGYIVWGEFADWGCGGFGQNDDHQQPTASYITQWLEAIERDYSHPSIVGWCPLNETWQAISDRISNLSDVTHGMYLATKALDTTRPVLDSSGYAHLVPFADVYDSHDYEQNVEAFRAKHGPSPEWQAFVNLGWRDQSATSIPYRGQPYFVSEFGGIWWNPNAKPGEDSWGYGDRPTSLDAFYDRFEGLCGVLLDNPAMFAYCYTQLTDVYQEQNGIYTFDRQPKFDMDKIKAAQVRAAAYEEGNTEALKHLRHET